MPAGFPENFIWGLAASAYQIEGAAHADGRGVSIWDTFSHTPGRTKFGETGDVACDHYHRYPEDISIMRSLGVKHYRFSTAWPRILPEGVGSINPAGLDFYDRLVDELLAAGIQPWLTLFHWDLPQTLQDRGGWSNRETALAFVDYASLMARRFGDRVQNWITHNEPWCTAFLGHQIGIHAPGMRSLAAALQTAHHVLLSHGLAASAIRSFAPTAQVGIALNLAAPYPATARPLDVDAARRYDGYFNRWFLDPLAGRGYPMDLWEYYGESVPLIKGDDFAVIAAPLDFLGINYYDPIQVAHDDDAPAPGIRNIPDPRLERTADREIDARWLRRILTRLQAEYPFDKLVITENGAAFHDQPSSDGKVHDPARIRFLQAHLDQVSAALAQGVPVEGYFIWSLLDNFEWSEGYSLRYGVVYVDFDTQQRIVKDSGWWYRDWIAA